MGRVALFQITLFQFGSAGEAWGHCVFDRNFKRLGLSQLTAARDHEN